MKQGIRVSGYQGLHPVNSTWTTEGHLAARLRHRQKSSATGIFYNRLVKRDQEVTDNFVFVFYVFRIYNFVNILIFLAW